MLQLALLLGLAGSAPAPVSATPRGEAGEKREPAGSRRDRRRDADDDDEEEGRVAPGSPIVVTGRRLDAARSEIDAARGATVYTLSNEAVENRPGGETGRIADILLQAPGAALAGGSLVVRGARPSQVRINDVIVPEAVSDPAEHLSARLAATTRLMTGTLPAGYGFAPGGVISVTTKSGLYQHGGQAELFAGTRGMLEPAAEWSGSAGGTSLFASGSFERDRSVVADANGASVRDARREFGSLAFADHVLDPHNRVSLILGGSRESHRIGAAAPGPATARSADGYAVGTFQHSDDGFTLQASLFAGTGTESAAFALSSRERRSAFGTQVDAAQPLGTGHVLRFGLFASRAKVRERAPGAGETRAARTSGALYLQDEWKVAPGLTFNPGVRAEWLRRFGAHATFEPRASLVWSVDEDLGAHVGYARYAAAPPLGEAGGAALHEERDDVYDAGLRKKIGALTLGIDGYWRAARNLLASHETPGSAVRTPFAFRRGRVRGAELSATYAERGTTAWANVTLSSASGRTLVGGEGLFSAATIAAAAVRPVPLASNRPVTASGGFTRRLDEVTVSADVLASSGTVHTLAPGGPNGARGPAYVLIGLAAVYRARIAGHATDVRVDFSNLADVRTAVAEGRALEGGWTRQARGRALVLGIESAF